MMIPSEAALHAKLTQAIALHRQGRLAEAENVCGDILQYRPHDVYALHLLGVLALQTGRTDKGVAYLREVIARDPNFAHAYLNLGNGLRDLKQPDAALEAYDRAILLQPDLAEAFSNRGNALTELRRPEDALASYDKAQMLQPGNAAAYGNRARALMDLGRLEEARDACDKAIALNPRLASTWGSRAVALNKLRRHGDSIIAWQRLLELDPRHPFVKGMLLFQKTQSCDWNGLAPLIAEIEADIAAERKSADPFGWQGVAQSPQSLRHCAEIFNRSRFPQIARGFSYNHGHEKTRIGYLSGEFREHATALLLAGVLEHHDRDEFEIFAIDNGWDDGSQTRGRVEKAVHQTLDIAHLSDSDAAARINASGIDILVNLNGYFGGGRMGVFAQRPAPIQVNYLGFPGTLGAGYIDYLVADAVVIPESDRQFYAEKIVALPHCYQANDDRKDIATEAFSRAQCGLPETGFVFCCFNNNYKILPEIFGVWMEILARVPGSVLWLLQDNETAMANLKKEAMARGIAAERLIFADRMPLARHLARHRCADLFLDTLPYNAHTTASDALWAGLPVLTCRGGTFPGRVAASLLAAIKLPDLITANLADYQWLAVTLATEPQRLADIRQKLDTNRLATPLFDTKAFTRHIEAAWRAMIQRHRAGLAPDHIVLTP